MLGISGVLLLLCLLCILGYSWYRLHKEIAIRVSPSSLIPEQYHLPYQGYSVTTIDGENLEGWYIPAKNRKAVVILCHGRLSENGGKGLTLLHAKYLYEHGYSCVLFDMRSVGKSSGRKVTLGVEEWKDVVAVYQYAKSLPENADKKIGFFGISMGASTAIIAAGKQRIGDFLIASVPYASFYSLFSYQVKQSGLFPNAVFTWALCLVALIELGPWYFRLEPLSTMHNIICPVFIMTAKNDKMVNPKDGWLLYEKANKPKEYWEADANHNVHGELQEDFESKILTFLQTYVG